MSIRKFSLIFIVFLFSISFVFSFSGSSTSYQTDTQLVIVSADGSSASYVTNSSSSIIDGNIVCSANNCSMPYVPVVSGGGSGGGGGGGGGAAGGVPAPAPSGLSTESQTVQRIDVDVPATYTFVETPVSQIVLEASQTIYAATITVVQKTEVPSSEATFSHGQAVLVLSIEHPKISNGSIASVSFVVHVPRENFSDLSQLGVYRLSEGSWNELSYSLVSQTNSEYVLNVTSPGLSYFVVSKKATVEQTAPTTQVVVAPPVDTSDNLPPTSVNDILPDNSTFASRAIMVAISIALGVLLIGGLVFYFVVTFKKSQNITVTSSEPAIKTDTQLRKFNNLDVWILKGISKGLTPKQLRDMLIKIGWKPEQFEEDFNRVIETLNGKQ